MPNYANRTIMPSRGLRLVGTLLVGFVLACAWVYSWKHLILTEAQSQGLRVYAVLSARNAIASVRDRLSGLHMQGRVPRLPVPPARRMQQALQRFVYDGDTFLDVLKLPVGGFLGILVASWITGAALEFRFARRIRNGIKLRGPDVMTVDEFNKTSKGDGIAFQVQERIQR